MNKITIKDFYKYLDNKQSILYKYDFDRFSELNETEYNFYQDNNLLILQELINNEYNIYAWLEKDCEYEQVFYKYLLDDKCVGVAISTCDFLPSEITKYHGGLAFTRKGEQNIDNDVVPLTEKDTEAILQFCNKLDQENDYAIDEAETIRYIVQEKLFTLFGIYNDINEIIGVVFYRMITEKSLGVVSELAVLRAYQEKGNGKRLVKKVLGVNKDYDYIYTCHKQNYRSIGLAEACGFRFCGVKNFRIK